MSWKRLVARTISECWKLCSSGAVGRGAGLRILLYHSIGSRLRHDPYGISIDAALFERQMALLAGRRDLRLVGLRDWLPASQGLQVAVTFDDGFKDNLYEAAPVLRRYAIPFTVFATPSLLESGSDEYLTPRELRELASFPQAAVGSHGATHRPLAACDNVTLEKELAGSRRYLEDLLGGPVSVIAYPHGSADLRVAQAARQAGYTIGLCSHRGMNDPLRDPMLLCRTEVLASDSERLFLQKLNGAWDWLGWTERDPASVSSQCPAGSLKPSAMKRVRR